MHVCYSKDSLPIDPSLLGFWFPQALPHKATSRWFTHLFECSLKILISSPSPSCVCLSLVYSLGQLCSFTRVCCFYPSLCSKKKPSVIVAHFMLSLPFFLLLHPNGLTSTFYLVCSTLFFVSNPTPTRCHHGHNTSHHTQKSFFARNG